MVSAAVTERSLWAMSWAFAANTPTTAEASESPAIRYAVLDMRCLLDGSRSLNAAREFGFHEKREQRSYFNCAATLSMPALAQASSLSPPGAPEMPMAPMVSLPTMIGSAPCAATKLVRKKFPALGLPLTASANFPDGARVVRAV